MLLIGGSLSFAGVSGASLDQLLTRLSCSTQAQYNT